jgi:hypothetical protein
MSVFVCTQRGKARKPPTQITELREEIRLRDFQNKNKEF